MDPPINYFDATDGPAGNTRHEDGSVLAATATPVGNDNLWCKRAYGNGQTVFTSNDGTPGGGEDSTALVTTITGLRPGEEYNIYAYFWSDQHDWHLGASTTKPVEGKPVRAFSKRGSDGTSTAQAADPRGFARPVVVTDNNRELFQADWPHARRCSRQHSGLDR